MSDRSFMVSAVAKLTLILILGLFLEDVSRAVEVRAEHLKIVWDLKKSRKLPQDKEDRRTHLKAWEHACQALGNQMLVGRGPWGFGAFTSYACYINNRRVAGSSRPGNWVLIVRDGAKSADFRIKSKFKSKAIDIASLQLPPSEYTFQFFLDPEFTDLMAYALLEQLPMGAMVTKSIVKGSPPVFEGRHSRVGHTGQFKYEVPTPPERLVFFHLEQDVKEHLWKSDVKGSSKLKAIEGPKPIRSDDDEKVKLVGGKVIYDIEPSVAEALEDGILWAQNANGPGSKTSELKKIIDEAHLKLNAAAKDGDLIEFIKGEVLSLTALLIETAASGYVGLRYGLQILPGEDLVSKTSVFSLLVEVRGGPFEGIRYYYDILPETATTLPQEGGGTVMPSIAWSRHVLGYSFDFDPGFLVDRVTIDPKIGVWTFEAEMPVAYNIDGEVVDLGDFRLGNTLSSALELGIELQSNWYTLRGWGGIDTGFSLLKTGGSVTSQRYGIDAYFTAGPSFLLFGYPVKAALLGFFIFESVNLAGGNEAELEAGEISGIGYEAGYAGGGIALSW